MIDPWLIIYRLENKPEKRGTTGILRRKPIAVVVIGHMEGHSDWFALLLHSRSLTHHGSPTFLLLCKIHLNDPFLAEALSFFLTNSRTLLWLSTFHIYRFTKIQNLKAVVKFFKEKMMKNFERVL